MPYGITDFMMLDSQGEYKTVRHIQDSHGQIMAYIRQSYGLYKPVIWHRVREELKRDHVPGTVPYGIADVMMSAPTNIYDSRIRQENVRQSRHI